MPPFAFAGPQVDVNATLGSRAHLTQPDEHRTVQLSTARGIAPVFRRGNLSYIEPTTMLIAPLDVSPVGGVCLWRVHRGLGAVFPWARSNDPSGVHCG